MQNRLVVMTVGKTHSGKTTFAKSLEKRLDYSLIVDQDNHAEFIHTYYKSLLPKNGPNTIKYAITKTIVDYAVYQTEFHLILCNSNRSFRERINLLDFFHKNGFMSILVHFDIPDDILKERVANSERSKTIFRTASSFEDVLERQQQEDKEPQKNLSPTAEEVSYFFNVKNNDEVQLTIERIIDIAEYY